MGAKDDGDDTELTALVLSAAAGDDLAWRRLWEVLEPRLLGLVRSPRFLGRLAVQEDDCRNVALAVMEHLGADDRRRLRRFAEAVGRDPSRRFWPWLVVVARRVGIDHIRAHEQYIGRRGGPSASRPAWAHITTVSDGKVGALRPEVTRRGTARQLFELAADRLSGPQRTALELWLEGNEHADIAGRLGLASARDAERLVRAGLERLRRALRERGEL